MLRTTISKIKKACSTSVVPRILQGELKYAPKKFSKHSMLAQAGKSTSSSDTGNKDEKTEENTPGEAKIETQEKTEENLVKTVAQTEEDKINELCQRIISKNAHIKPIEGAVVNATPNKGEIEWEQKVEKIEEPSLVETPEEFEEQIGPKVLASQQILQASEETESEEVSGSYYDSSYDEVATKCLAVPPDEVDDYILKELRKYNEDIAGSLYENKPVEWYYSDAIYTPQQIIPLGHANSVPAVTGTKTPETTDMKDTCILDVYKSDTPRAVDSLSMYGDETGIADPFLERPDFETPLIINPYDNNLIFPLDTYMLRDDDLPTELPSVQESLAPSEMFARSNFGNNEVMPPPEMEVEIDRPGISKQLQGSMAGISLGVPDDMNTSQSRTPTQMSFNDSGFNMYSRTQYPTGPPYGYWPNQIKQHNQRQPVVPNTSISSKSEKKQSLKGGDSSISSQQRLYDMYMAEIKLLQEMQSLETETPERPNLVSKQSDFKEPIQPNPNCCVKEPVYHRHTAPPDNPFLFSKPGIKETVQSMPNCFVNKNSIPQKQPDTSETPVVLSKQPDIKDTIQSMPNCFVRKDPISHILFEPEPKPEHLKPPTSPKTEQQDYKSQSTFAQQSFNSKLTATTGPVPSVAEESTELPLKEMLRRIRERHRQEQCQQFFNETAQHTHVHMSTACQPVKMPFPPPCKPRPKEEKTESPSKCPPPKKDTPKDPCAKFSQIPDDIYNAICFVRLSQSTADIVNSHAFSILNDQISKEHSQAMSSHALNSLGNALEKELVDEDLGEGIGDIILSRDYEPWTPIPSWPIPEKEKKRKLVTPKEGCKLLPPPRLHPSQKDKPCVSFPKKTFSLAELLEHQPVANIRYFQ